MLSRLSILEDINPWTQRHSSTIDTFRQSRSDRFTRETHFSLASKLLLIPAQPKMERLGVDRGKMRVSRHFHPHEDYRIPTLSLEKVPLEHIEKTLTFNFQSHFKPFKCKSNQNRPCFISSPLKWAQRKSHLTNKHESNEKGPIKINIKTMKMRRYYTQQIEVADQPSGEDTMEAFANLLSVNRLTAVNNHLHAENIKEQTRIHTLELTEKPPSFHETKVGSKQSPIRGGHLSQMKKVYNRKKLQRLTRL